MTIQTPPVTTALILLIAADSGATPRTVKRRLAGATVRGSLAERIDAAALARGIAPPGVAA